MHQKKSEEQIGTESSGISSDFNPNPPLLPLSLTHKHAHLSQNLNSIFNLPPAFYTVNSSPALDILIGDDEHKQEQEKIESFVFKPTLFKRALIQQQLSSCLAKTPTLLKALHRYGVSAKRPCTKFNLFYTRPLKFLTQFHQPLQRLRLLLSLPFFYFLVSHPSGLYILDCLSAFALSAALLLSLSLAIPHLSTIILFLVRSFPITVGKKYHVSQWLLPLFWRIGSWKKADNDVVSGCYVEGYSNGDAYKGEFHQGKYSGGGVYYYYMSGRYEGDWISGNYDGYGIETWTKGSQYKGCYKLGLRHGIGVYRFHTGDVYAGEWSDGHCHGRGIHTCEDGSRYVGEFKCGLKQGLGHHHFRNGDRYAGEYLADQMHGFGVYCFSNGQRYEGAWCEGRREGLGIYTFRNGETQSGRWQNGVLGVPSTQSNFHRVSLVAVNHSKVLNVVQEARQAAEKAYEITKVDERVNRAVAAANMAANSARAAAARAVQKQMQRWNSS